jgi:Calcineurin-like phosphoesterase
MDGSALGRIAAIGCAAALAQCGTAAPESLPLIGSGAAVRIVPSTASGCPSGWDENDFDDRSWGITWLPIAVVPSGGACLRKEFDIGADPARWRWLKIRFSGRSRARLNAERPVTAATEQGLDWSTDDEGSADAEAAQREYTLDLRLFPTLLQAQRNVLALQVPPTTRPLGIEARLLPDDGSASQYVQVVKGPYQVHPSATSTRIAWESDRSAPSWAIVDGRRYDGGWAMHHEVQLDGLVAGRRYSFYVETAQASALPPECASLITSAVKLDVLDGSDEFWKYVQRRDACNRVVRAIRTDTIDLRGAPALDGAVRLAIVGDTRAEAMAAEGGLSARVAGELPDLVVHTGDLVASADEGQWQALFDGMRPLLQRAPLAPVPGERDVASSSGGARFAQLFGVAAHSGGNAAGRAYAVDVGAVHVALLDSTAPLGGQADWLEADLAAAEQRGARHVFVVVHWGPFSAGPAGGNPEALAAIVPVVRRHKVDAVVSGHDAIYEHGVDDGLHYFVTGGAGNAVDPVAPTPDTQLARSVPHYLVIESVGATATVRAKDAAGTVLDEVAITP